MVARLFGRQNSNQSTDGQQQLPPSEGYNDNGIDLQSSSEARDNLQIAANVVPSNSLPQLTQGDHQHQPPPQQRDKARNWHHALSTPIRYAQQVARTTNDAPLKVALGVSHLARAASDGVTNVSKKSVSFVKQTTMEISPLRKHQRHVKKQVNIVDELDHKEDATNDGEELIGDDEHEVGDETTDAFSDHVSIMSRIMRAFTMTTTKQLQEVALAMLVLVMLATLFYWKRVVVDHWPTLLVFSWIVMSFCAGRAIEAMIAEDRGSPHPVLEASVQGKRQQLKHGRKRPVKSKQIVKLSKTVTPRTILAKGTSGVQLKQIECNEDIQTKLMHQLLQNPQFRHKKVLSQDRREINLSTSADESKEPLIAQVVDPICKLRGMDAFLMDTAEDDLASHPFLLTNGLRDVPTFMVNLVAQWGNLVLYYELPSWFESWKSLSEDDDDPTDVKALKRFLSNDDDYRTSRIRMLPSVVEGPLPVRVLAPPKKEISVEGKWLACSWKKHETEVTSNGKRLAPLLEMELDLVSNRTIRGMTSIVKRYLSCLSVDIALTLQKPNGHTDIDEPEACLCVWRFHHVDLTGCPPLPDRGEKMAVVVEEAEVPKMDRHHPDVVRASQYVRLSDEELNHLSLLVET